VKHAALWRRQGLVRLIRLIAYSLDGSEVTIPDVAMQLTAKTQDLFVYSLAFDTYFQASKFQTPITRI
jgi:hypothetical protein